MSTRLELIAWLLDQIDVRNGDQWYDECCSVCYRDPWHSVDRYGDVPITQRTAENEAHPRCKCACHEARKVLGREDRLSNPREGQPL